tara:strand:+ start:4412 stop:5857 length:1446 start_codon:yes stop_codon:yes gene_type:complete
VLAEGVAAGAAEAASPRSASSQFALQRRALSPRDDGRELQLRPGGKGRKGAKESRARAAEGVAGGGGALPHAEAIQKSFGSHDLSSVRGHVGGKAAGAASDIGAQAYAMGNDVAFASTPDLHTAAHEAAHVVQQRAGVQLQGGMGKEGDAYERQADAVADAVVQGRSAEPILNRTAGPAGSSGALQKRELPKKQVSAQAMTRIGQARKAIDHTKQVLKHGAGNQKEALEATRFNSYFRMAAMRDHEAWHIDPGVRALARKYPEALVAAKADLAQGGNCGEHAMVAFDYLRQIAGSDEVNRVSVKGLDHAFVLIGSIKKDDDGEIGACDPWPTRPTACLWEDHFAHAAKSEINVANSVSGDDADVKAAIASGLSLSAKGQMYVKHAYDEQKTREAIEEGTRREAPSDEHPEGIKPWIWDHANAASDEFDYVGPEPAPPSEQAQAPAADSALASASTGAGAAQTEDQGQGGFGAFIAWLRRFI